MQRGTTRFEASKTQEGSRTVDASVRKDESEPKLMSMAKLCIGDRQGL
jgi:hypothetical protein